MGKKTLACISIDDNSILASTQDKHASSVWEPLLRGDAVYSGIQQRVRGSLQMAHRGSHVALRRPQVRPEAQVALDPAGFQWARVSACGCGWLGVVGRGGCVWRDVGVILGQMGAMWWQLPWAVAVGNDLGQ